MNPISLGKSGLCVSVALALMGCEARLDLAGVQQELSKPVRRTDQLQSIARNDSHLVAVGAHGLILTAAASPQPNWQRLEVDGAASFVDVESCPDQRFVALAMNRTVWVSDSAGQNWASHPVESMENLLTLACTPDNTLWLGGSFSTLMSSTDGAVSWATQSLDQDAMFTDIHFVDAQNGVAVGEFGMVLRTTDGGQQWQPINPIPNDFYPQSAWFQDVNEGWVTGLGGNVLHTRDGGQNWQAQTTGTDAPIYGIAALPGGPGNASLFAVGDHSHLLLYRDGQWQPQTVSPAPFFLRDGVEVNGHLILVGGGGAIHSVNLGQAQQALSPSSSQHLAEH